MELGSSSLQEGRVGSPLLHSVRRVADLQRRLVGRRKTSDYMDWGPSPDGLAEQDALIGDFLIVHGDPPPPISACKTRRLGRTVVAPIFDRKWAKVFYRPKDYRLLL